MGTTTKALAVFCLVGIAGWLLMGFVVDLACFAPNYPPSVLERDRTLNAKVMAEWDSVVMKHTSLVWAAIGAAFGPLTWAIYLTKPAWQHLTRPATRPPFDTKLEPKTVAEQRTIFQATALATVLQAAVAYFVLPYFQTTLVVVRSAGIRVVIAALAGLLASGIPAVGFKFTRRR